MDWTNERYVRVYVRDTADLLAIGWEGRTVLWEMMRKSDRAGVVDGDGDTLPDLLRMPREVVDAGLMALIRRNVVVLGQIGGSPAYLIRNFLEAQEARQSDAQRQRESRAKRRDAMRGIVTNCDAEHAVAEQAVTKRDENVTRCHTLSHAVTPSLAVPSHALSKDPTDPLSDKQSDVVRKIWEFFCSERKKAVPGARQLALTATRAAHIRARLKRHEPKEICKVARRFFDPELWWAQNGEHRPELVFRSEEQFEKIRDARPRSDGTRGDNSKPAAPAPPYHREWVPPELAELTKGIGSGGRP